MIHNPQNIHKETTLKDKNVKNLTSILLYQIQIQIQIRIKIVNLVTLLKNKTA